MFLPSVLVDSEIASQGLNDHLYWLIAKPIQPSVIFLQINLWPSHLIGQSEEFLIFIVSLRQLIFRPIPFVKSVIVIFEYFFIDCSGQALLGEDGQVDIFPHDILFEMMHDDSMVRGNLSRLIGIFKDIGLMATRLEIIVNKIMLKCVKRLPLGKPDLFSLGHLVIELVNFSEVNDIWN